MHLHLFSQITTSLLNERQIEANVPWLVTFLFFSGMLSREACACMYVYINNFWGGQYQFTLSVEMRTLLFKHLFD